MPANVTHNDYRHNISESLAYHDVEINFYCIHQTEHKKKALKIPKRTGKQLQLISVNVEADIPWLVRRDLQRMTPIIANSDKYDMGG